MKTRSAMLISVATLVMLGFVVGCCNEPVEQPATPTPTETATPTDIETRYVVIANVGDANVCSVIPYERKMDGGVTHVTFINLTAIDGLEIAFDDANAIGDTNKHPVKSEGAVTFEIKDTQPGKEFFYVIHHTCFKPATAGPRIIIPSGP